MRILAVNALLRQPFLHAAQFFCGVAILAVDAVHQLAVCLADMTRRNDSIKTNFRADVARIKMGCSGGHHQQRPARAICVYACNGPRLKAFARNLLGRSLLDEGKPEEAQKWFLENYKDQQFRDRAADSVLFLAEATKRQKDTGRACIALAQFVDEFPGEAAGRLKSQYDATRTGLKCD